MQITVNKGSFKYLLFVIVVLGGFLLFTQTDSYKKLNYPLEYVSVNEQVRVGSFDVKYLGYEINPENHPKKSKVKAGYQIVQGEFLIKNIDLESEDLEMAFFQVSVDGIYYKCYFDLNDFDVYDSMESGEVRQLKVYSYVPKNPKYSFFVFLDNYHHVDDYTYGYFAIKP